MLVIIWNSASTVAAKWVHHLESTFITEQTEPFMVLQLFLLRLYVGQISVQPNFVILQSN